jgi:hypothetical protein
MIIELNEEERDLILELIADAEEKAIQGIDHADTRDFKNILRKPFGCAGVRKGEDRTRRQTGRLTLRPPNNLLSGGRAHITMRIETAGGAKRWHGTCQYY